MHLEDMTGLELAQKIRAEQPVLSTGFILITSQADTQEAKLLDQAANIIRLPKPFDADQLAEALAAAAGGPQRQTHSGPG
jgi:CheY-like chemotaxis protein